MLQGIGGITPEVLRRFRFQLQTAIAGAVAGGRRPLYIRGHYNTPPRDSPRKVCISDGRKSPHNQDFVDTERGRMGSERGVGDAVAGRPHKHPEDIGQQVRRPRSSDRILRNRRVCRGAHCAPEPPRTHTTSITVCPQPSGA